MDTERRLERYRAADRWPTEEALAAMLDNQMGAFAAVRQALPALGAAVQAAALRLRDDAGRLVYVGAGASGRLAVQDGVELYPTFAWPHDRLIYIVAGGEAALIQSREGAEDDAEAGAGARRARHRPGRRGPRHRRLGHHRLHPRRHQDGTRAGALTIGMANNPPPCCWPRPSIAILFLATGPEFAAFDPG
ncbi:MAG: hypothetical protein R3D25_15845 [Geminicoccaceae bacterium]